MASKPSSSTCRQRRRNSSQGTLGSTSTENRRLCGMGVPRVASDLGGNNPVAARQDDSVRSIMPTIGRGQGVADGRPEAFGGVHQGTRDRAELAEKFGGLRGTAELHGRIVPDEGDVVKARCFQNPSHAVGV